MICYYADLGSKCLRLVKENFPCGTTNQEQYLDLRSATSLVWNFFTRSTDFFSRENHIVDGQACLVIININFFQSFATLFYSFVCFDSHHP